MSKASEKIKVKIILMQNDKQKLKSITVQIPSSLQLFQLTNFLKQNEKLPFNNCTYTTKPAQKGQFTIQKTLRQIVSHCKKVEEEYILLCYESKIQSNIENQDEVRSSKISSAQNQSNNSSKKQSQISENKQLNFKKGKPQKQESDCELF